MPVAGVEPARVISPTDFESASSANSNTPARFNADDIITHPIEKIKSFTKKANSSMIKRRMQIYAEVK